MDVTISHAEGFLTVIAEGPFDLEQAKGAVKEMVAANPDGLDLLIDVRKVPQPVSLVELSPLAREFATLVGNEHKAALLVSQQQFDNGVFFSVFVRSMGGRMQLFLSLEEASNWLLNTTLEPEAG